MSCFIGGCFDTLRLRLNHGNVFRSLAGELRHAQVRAEARGSDVGGDQAAARKGCVPAAGPFRQGFHYRGCSCQGEESLLCCRWLMYVDRVCLARSRLRLNYVPYYLCTYITYSSRAAALPSSCCCRRRRCFYCCFPCTVLYVLACLLS